jgi:CRP-like cAMP-binding protein
MQIDYNILITYGAATKKYEKGSVIFREGSIPHFFHQIVEGEVKLFSRNNEGKDFIQGMFASGQTFGEAPVLLNILKDFPDITHQMVFSLAERIYQKAVSAQTLLCHTPEEKILSFFHTIKDTTQKKDHILIPFTRQQIADFTSLRVETVIRTLLRMHKQKKINIIEHKIYF